MASTFTPDGSNGGTFDCEAGTYAVGRVTLTTAAPDDEVSLKFLTTRRPLVFRVGTASGEQDIYADIEFRPGVHVVSFTPGVSPYYVEFQLQEVGEAAEGHIRCMAGGSRVAGNTRVSVAALHDSL